MALKAAVSVTPLPSPPLRRLLSLASSRSAAARRLARVSAAMAVQPAVVVGGGRVGQALLSMGPPGADVLVGRGEKVPDDAPGPILVCTRNDDLDAVLDATPKSRWRGTWPQLVCLHLPVRFRVRLCCGPCLRSGLPAHVSLLGCIFG